MLADASTAARSQSPGGDQNNAPGLFGVFAGSAPPERLAVVRIAVFAFGAIYLSVRAPGILSVTELPASRFAPVGPITALDSPVSSSVLLGAILITIVASVAASIGLRFRASGPVAAVGLLLVLTYRLSWGQILHTENLLVVHALLLAVMPAGDAWAIGAPRSDQSTPRWQYGWALQTLALATIVGYAVAAYAKAKNGGLDWITGDVLRNHIAYDNLQKELLGDVSSPLVDLTVPHGWLFPPMAAASMVIEIGAVAALARGAIRPIWVGATWMFHVAILVLMAILFPYQLLGIAFLPLVEGERVVRRFSPAFRRRLEALRR